MVGQNIYANFLDEYAARAPLQGRAFNHDVSKVHSYIIRFISENNVAEQKVLPFKDDNNGRLDFITLRGFYEGVGANARATLSAEADLQDMFYAGAKPPHIWWDEFEIRLTNAFAVVDKEAGRQVHMDEMKFRLLNRKVRADFLSTIKTHIEIQMTMVPMVVTYASALANYCNVVNQRFPQGSAIKKTNCRVQSSNTSRGVEVTVAVGETEEAKVAVADKAEAATITAGEMTTGMSLALMEGRSMSTLPTSLSTTNGLTYQQKLDNNSSNYAERTGIEKGQETTITTKAISLE